MNKLLFIIVLILACMFCHCGEYIKEQTGFLEDIDCILDIEIQGFNKYVFYKNKEGYLDYFNLSNFSINTFKVKYNKCD
jgi:hypothetical protein